MRKNLLPLKRAYKANLHVHSTFSDGQMTPEEIKELYLSHGYSIVAYTDHEMIVPHNELRDEKFLPITAYELAVNESSNGKRFEHFKTYHLNFFSRDPECNFSSAFSYSRMHWDAAKVFLPEDKHGYECSYKEYSVESVNRLIAEARNEGFLVSYNHPVWSQQSYPDYIGLRGLFGVEIHNTECKRMGYYDTVAPWCDLLKSGERLFPLATDDAHSINGALGGWIWVMADELEYGAVFEALEKGDFYASTGPVIEEISIDGGSLLVRTSDAVRVDLNTERRFSISLGDGVKPNREFVFNLSGFLEESKNAVSSPYFRLTVWDENGAFAISRAYFTDEID